MQHKQAIEMLSLPELNDSEPRVWADFGCGSGTFTLALAQHLAAHSRIIAIDKESSTLNNIPDQFKNISIEKIESDFTKISFSSINLDGILMANSLHYVQCQEEFIDRVKNFLKPKGCFLIVEYDTDRSNPWIPFPLSFNRLSTLFSKAGFSIIKKIHEIPSRYNRSNLYSALVR